MKPYKATILLFFLSTLALQASCFSFSGVASLPFNSRPLMNAYASSTGEISILKDLNGYYVYIDLTSVNTTGQVGDDTVRMMLSLTNNNLLLIDSCLNFNQYPCDYYHCKRDSGDVYEVQYPNLVASAIKVSTEAYLDYKYWDIEEKAWLATACSSSYSGYIGAGRYGILGLGTSGFSKSNFLKTREFSIYFNSDRQGGILKFANDQKYATYAIGNISANANWIVPINGFTQVTPYTSNFNGSLAFDIHADALGLPLKTFQWVVDKIAQSQWISNITCTNDTFQPTCNYQGFISKLPSIYIGTGQNSVGFDIPPEIYVKNAYDKDQYVYSITLNLKALDPYLTGESYVTPDYSNTIFLDARTMSAFYLVFDATSGSNIIGIYKANPNPRDNNPSNKWWIYLIVVVFIFIVTGGCCGCVKRRMANARTPATIVTQTTQAPLIVADTSAIVSGYNYQAYPGAVPIVQVQGQGNYYQQQPQGMVYGPPSVGGYSQPGGN